MAENEDPSADVSAGPEEQEGSEERAGSALREVGVVFRHPA